MFNSASVYASGLYGVYNEDPFAYLTLAITGGFLTGAVLLIIAAIWDYYSDKQDISDYEKGSNYGGTKVVDSVYE